MKHLSLKTKNITNKKERLYLRLSINISICMEISMDSKPQ